MQRMGRGRDFPDPEDRKALARLAQEAVDQFGKETVLKKVGVNQTSLDRWLTANRTGEGAGMSRLSAQALAKLAGTTLDRVLGTNPDLQAHAGRLTPEASESTTRGVVSRTGVDVALAALRQLAEDGPAFPNLALFLEVNDRRRADRKRAWDMWVIIAAAAGMAGAEDFPPEEWEGVLDSIERAGMNVQRESGSHPTPPKLLSR